MARKEDILIGEDVTDNQGRGVGRSYYRLIRNKCVKWKKIENDFENRTQLVDRGEGKKVREKVKNRLRGECLEYSTRVYAPKDFARKMKSILTPENIAKIPRIKKEIRELKAIKDLEYERANSLLLCLENLESLIERESEINPLKLKPKDYNIAWVSVGRLLGSALRLKRNLLAEQKRNYARSSYALQGSIIYDNLKHLPWLGKKLKKIRKKDFFPTLAFKLDSIHESLVKKRNYLTSMIYLTEAEETLFKTFRDRSLSRIERDRKVLKIKEDLRSNLRYFLDRNLEERLGLTLSRVFMQKLDILREKYFRG